ncbi:hypothetical protein RchiOBHm_Chr5g0018741 [Rosa chinensis]|uniref:Uncharacterized protein n=1 Tax=Rosa chinensis TaxID=74649 RepID=A0A2P6Q6T9_ROSCH|nr:hypothetical protein RchiOBHm_Chr5g0018741 [Rosa chinensis]
MCAVKLAFLNNKAKRTVKACRVCYCANVYNDAFGVLPSLCNQNSYEIWPKLKLNLLLSPSLTLIFLSPSKASRNLKPLPAPPPKSSHSLSPRSHPLSSPTSQLSNPPPPSTSPPPSPVSHRRRSSISSVSPTISEPLSRDSHPNFLIRFFKYAPFRSNSRLSNP